MTLDPSIIFDNWGLFVEGALMTLRLATIAFFGGIGLGGIIATLGLMPSRILRALVISWLAVMRGIPFIVIVFVIHLGLPVIGMRMPPEVSGAIALTLFASAYYAEIIRGCVLSLPKGQWEAARVVGMSPVATARHVIIPQIISPAVPPVVNTTMSMIKESSVLSSITVAELTYQGLVVQGNTFAPFEVFIAVALLYWLITSLFAFLAGLFERRSGAAASRTRMGPLAARYLVLDQRSSS